VKRVDDERLRADLAVRSRVAAPRASQNGTIRATSSWGLNGLPHSHPRQAAARRSINVGGARGQKDDGNAPRPGERAADLKAILTGHHNVQHEEVGLELPRFAQRLATVARCLDAIAAASQVHGDEVDDMLIVIGHEDECSGRCLSRTFGRFLGIALHH
jgi:hypothetical protein